MCSIAVKYVFSTYSKFPGSDVVQPMWTKSLSDNNKAPSAVGIIQRIMALD